MKNEKRKKTTWAFQNIKYKKFGVFCCNILLSSKLLFLKCDIYTNTIYAKYNQVLIGPSSIQLQFCIFQGYVKRQRTFSHDWFFRCHCPRCSDPTEFATFTSAVKCFQCSKGFVMPYPTLLNYSDNELNGKGSNENG